MCHMNCPKSSGYKVKQLLYLKDYKTSVLKNLTNSSFWTLFIQTWLLITNLFPLLNVAAFSILCVRVTPSIICIVSV
jgi:hypothetical protein